MASQEPTESPGLDPSTGQVSDTVASPPAGSTWAESHPSPLAGSAQPEATVASEVVGSARVRIGGDGVGGSRNLGLFGEYELLEEVGRGAMGVVYKARQVELDRVVALKMILGGEHSSSTVIRRFRIEAETAGHLDHSCIVPVFHVGEREGRHFYAMGFVEGESLARKVASGPFEQDRAAELVWLIAGAIQHAHSRGVIHRDLKPSNIMVDPEGRPKVTDFGLAKSLEADSALTVTGEILGTPSYMSPEQAAGRVHEVGPSADIYALGAILYCLLTGRPPFQGPTTMETLSQVINDDPVPPRKLQPKTDRDLETICLKCLAKSPVHRYATAGELAIDLRRFLDDETIIARRPGPIYRLRKLAARRRDQVIATGSAVAAASLLLVGSIWWTRSERARRMDERLDEGRAKLVRAVEAKPTVDAEPLFEAAMLSFVRAQEIDPKAKEPLDGLIGVYLSRARRSIEGGDFGAARALIMPLRNLDRSRRFSLEVDGLERKAIGTSRWKIDSTPSGAEVTLSVLDADQSPGLPKTLGTTPRAEEDVPPGDYLLTLTAPDHAETRLPVSIGRAETRAIRAALPRVDEVPEGMVYVPAGPSRLGDPQTGTEQVVEVEGFFIDRMEVSGREYERFVRATGCPTPESWRGSQDCPPGFRESPAFNVSWFEAYSYARWVGKRLPTEAQWEKAARGVDGRPYPWGRRFDARKVLSRDSPTAEALLVGRHREGASPYGCLDMAGNVWEWTLDREKPGLADRAIRGGASSSTPDELLTYRRKSAPPGGSSFGGLNLLGFRCVRPIVAGEEVPELLEALATGPDLAAAAEYYFEEERYERSRGFARKLLALNPRSPHGRFWTAAGLAREGKLADALAEFRAVWFQDFTFRSGRRNLQDEMDGTIKALQAKTQAGDLAFLEAPRWFDHARRALDAGHLDEARTPLETILRWDPDNEVALEEMAMLLDAKGEKAGAEEHRRRRVDAYRRSLAEGPDNDRIHNQFSEFLLHHEMEPEAAVEHARKATRLAPGVARYRRILAECLARVSDRPGALLEITEAANLDPEDEEIRVLLSTYRLEARKSGPNP